HTSAASAALVLGGIPSLAFGQSESDSAGEELSHDAIIRMTVAEGVAALASGRLSASDYCEAALAQAEKFRLYNMFSQMAPAYSRETARAVDTRRARGAAIGALEGLPYALKDSVDMVEFYTIAGHPSMKTFRPALDADLVTALKEADAVCVGKTQIPPLSMWWTTENEITGDTGNPFNHAYKTGGSSGGSGAAVAARIVPFAVAEDTGGSVRIPAAINGVLGLRPTTGRWPLGGAVPIGFSDTLGPIARTVADIRLLDTLFATDGPHRATQPLQISDLRIGYQTQDFLTNVHPWVGDNFEKTAERLARAGATIIELRGIESQAMYDIAIPLLLSEFPDAMARYFQRHGVYDRSAFGLMNELPEGLIKQSWVEPTISAPTGEARYPLIERMLSLRASAAEIIGSWGIDVFMYPSSLVPNTRNDGPKVMEQVGPLGRTLSELDIGKNMFFAPAMKTPSIAMFSGLDPDGLPLSVTFDSASGSDRRLLDIAEALEKVLPPLEEPESI
ncbi:MAG: amidase family protein, partial [Xanthomonadales bacterium]|nr:amidase family protein [Xanthomonadales bacterium]